VIAAETDGEAIGSAHEAAELRVMPASAQGTAFRSSGDPVPDLATPPGVSAESRRAGLGWLEKMNSEYAEAHTGDSAIEARVRSYEVAASMQLQVPEIADLKSETEATRRLYGLEKEEGGVFAKHCLLARRLIEKGVRFVQVYNGGNSFRYGALQKSPAGSVQGPKVMIVNEMAGSGGDMMPWMFRYTKTGTLVGKRTWGGLIGVLGFPALMDGGTITAPNLRIFSPSGEWIAENTGVVPDVEVELDPKAVAEGHDPQLERAVSIALEQLKKNPPPEPHRPPYPDYQHGFAVGTSATGRTGR
jgi:hypothetical protein